MTDSVVATARIVTNRLAKRIFIDWGDGQTDTIDTLPGVLLPTPFGQPDLLPKGTLEISHVYHETEDRRPFEHTLLLQVRNTDGTLGFKETHLLMDDTGHHRSFLNAFTESERIETDVEVSAVSAAVRSDCAMIARPR